MQSVYDGSADEASRRRKAAFQVGVAFLVVTIAASASAEPATAQFASVAVTAQVAASDEPAIRPLDYLPRATVDDPAVSDGWTERAHPGRPFVTRSRLRSEPHTGQSDTGLVLDVVMDYTGI